MSQTVQNEELWMSQRRIDLELAHEKQEVQQVARVRKSATHPTKDVILSAPLSEDQIKDERKESPKLAAPTTSYTGTSDDDESIIAIIAKVLVLQAKTNSNFWSIAWRTASQAMQTQVKLAKAVGENVKETWNQQANITNTEASTALWEGILGAGATVVTFGMGAYGAVKAGKLIPEDEAVTELGQKSEQVAEEDAAEDTSKLDKAKNWVKKGWERYGSRYLSKYQTRMKNFYTIYAESMQYAQMAGMMAQVGSQFATYSYKLQKAHFQKLAGESDSASKMFEQFAQFYNQLFARLEDLRQAAAQNIEYSMNVLKSASDSVTQTVTSMFRG